MGGWWLVALLLSMKPIAIKCTVNDNSYNDDNDDQSSRISQIWTNVVKSEEKSRVLKGSGRYGGMDAESNLVGGDIIVDPDEPHPSNLLVSLSPALSGRIGNAERQAIPLFTWHQKLWLTRDIPYFISAQARREDRSVILAGIDGIRKKMGGCLKFRPKRSSDKWWMEFYYGNGCNAPIGRKYWKTGPSRISIGQNCNYKDIVMHEILHTLGFAHEQSRRDRDRYVNIRLNNVLPGFESNFKKSSLTASFYFGTSYDYRSLMHYGKTAFGRSGKVTIERLRGPGTKLGSKDLSTGDVEEISRMYQCHQKKDGWSQWISTPCMCTSSKSFCSKAKVRMCLGTKKCPGSRQQYGTQYQATMCTRAEEGKDVASSWSSWSKYGACDSKCGWGFQERVRTRNSWKEEVDRKAKLCREKRCSAPRLGDSGSSFSKWDKTRFSLKKGGYVSASGKSAYLKSPLLKRYRGDTCIMFTYKMRAGYFKLYRQYTSSGSRKDLNFRKTGSQGSIWKRAAVTIPAREQRYNHKLVFKASSSKSRKNFVSITDVFVDPGKCPPGLNVCRDVKSGAYCRNRGDRGFCNHSNAVSRRSMYHECCATCQESKYRNKKARASCDDSNKQCGKWASSGECKKNAAWMLVNCAKSCGQC